MTIRETEIIAVGAEDTSVSSVSWAAVIAGALAAVSTSLILMVLGSGLGLTMVSPWTNAGATAATFAVSSIIWLVVVQWLSSAFGGYISGRLRTRWAGLHGDEVTFRDTAHGFLSWALATIIVAALLTSAVGAIVGGAVQTAASVTSGAAQGVAQGAMTSGGSLTDPTGYFVDALFRAPSSGASTEAAATPDSGATAPATGTTPPAPASTSPQAQAPALQAQASANRDIRGEATRILVAGLTGQEMAAPDKAYLTQLVASEAGISQADAGKRVDDVLAQVQAAKAKAKESADQARKASATLAMLTALALFVGAFIASVAGILGGKERDAP